MQNCLLPPNKSAAALKQVTASAKTKRKEKRTSKMFPIIGAPGDFNRIESNEAAGGILIVIR